MLRDNPIHSLCCTANGSLDLVDLWCRAAAPLAERSGMTMTCDIMHDYVPLPSWRKKILSMLSETLRDWKATLRPLHLLHGASYSLFFLMYLYAPMPTIATAKPIYS